MNEPTRPSEEALRKHFERIFTKAYAPRRIYNFVLRIKEHANRIREEMREDNWV
jgi:hypothetical protein